ncbi:hypothetical protein [Cohnella abietis]|uniref:Ferric siderophore reductase C-terminal domain-containing protein n=1 Tax=Cohnella abietis TaxID=2507935 RepID=A0A3T1CY85_9BACL|nr:hypothetical protein [Cohnella abietis]BBI30827.1 hypothetical protein KCTCHS21_02260 [Cohnella abietis]
MSAFIWEQLDKQFNIALEQRGEAVASISAAAFLDRDAMRSFLGAYKPLIEGLDDTVAAAYFSSWFGSIASAMHFSVSVHDVTPDFSLSNLTAHVIKETGFTRIGFQLTHGNVDQAPKDTMGRAAWRDLAFTQFYSHTARPLMECLSEASGLNVGLLWGQLPTALTNFREHCQTTIENEAVLRQLAEDEHFVQTGLPPQVFGRSKNPLHVSVRKIAHPLDPNKQLHMKNVCCLQYLRQDRYYCYTCPRLTKKERAEFKF